jgi:hypothetical protein
MAALARTLTPRDIRAWVAGAQPRAVLCYAVGFNAERDAAKGVAEEVRECRDLGYCYTTQKRVGPEKLLYLATRSSRPLSAGASPAPAPRRVREAV